MELSLKNVKNKSSYDIYQELELEIFELNNKYKFAGIDNDKFNKIVLDCISKSKNSYDGKSKYRDYIISIINENLIQEVKSILKDRKNVYKITDAFINQEFSNGIRSNSLTSAFSRISRFFERYEVETDIDLYTELIKNNSIFGNLVKEIYTANIASINNGDIDKCFNDEYLIDAIDTYCAINDIVIKDNIDDISLDSFYTTDAVKDYLREIGKIPLLTAQEEIELGEKVAKGDIEARNRFVEGNLRLVVSIAKRYINNGIDFLDLIQEGNTGLITAVNKYDLDKHCRFSTYSTWWIKQSITRAIHEKSRNIRIPVHVNILVLKYKSSYSRLSKTLNRVPSIQEIAADMDVSVTEAKKLSKLQFDTVSINSKVGVEDEVELGSFIPSGEDIEEDYVSKNLKEQLLRIFKSANLDERDIDVLNRCFGLNGHDKETLESVGSTYGVSRERVRQIKNKAILKIRNCSDSACLVDYADNPTAARKFVKASKNATTIYQDFVKFRRVDVDNMLSKFTPEERKEISSWYREREKDPINPSLTKEEKEKFSKYYKPLMDRIISNPRTPRRKLDPGYGDARKKIYGGRTYKSDIIPDDICKSLGNIVSESSFGDVCCDLNERDLSHILEFLRTTSKEIINENYNEEDKKIIALRYGYSNNTYFSPSAIASTLGVSNEHVQDVSKQTLNIFKNIFNNTVGKSSNKEEFEENIVRELTKSNKGQRN